MHTLPSFSQVNKAITAIPPSDRNIDTVAILIGERLGHRPQYIYRARIINPTKATIRFITQDNRTPIYSTREITGDSVSVKCDFFCAVGRGPYMLKPGQCFNFFIIEDPSAVQIGIQYEIYPSKEYKFTWSALK